MFQIHKILDKPTNGGLWDRFSRNIDFEVSQLRYHDILRQYLSHIAIDMQSFQVKLIDTFEFICQLADFLLRHNITTS